MNIMFADNTMPQIREAMHGEALLLLPLGETEQHGPHLQVGCDSIIAERVAGAVAAKISHEFPVLVLPTIAYGYTPKAVQNWPGTFRIRWEVMIRYLSDVLTSAAEMGFAKIVIVSTHGPHGEIARVAARDVFDRTGVGVVVSMPHVVGAKCFAGIRKSKVGGACHACEYETSLLLHFGYPVDLKDLDDRDHVKVCDEWVAGDFVNGSGKVSWSTWALQLSQTGIYGDASVASVETGRIIMDAIVEEYCRLLRYVRETKLPRQTFPIHPRSQ